MASVSPEPSHNHNHHHHHQHRPTTPAMQRTGSDKDRERDVHGLRMALGSILSPKRYPSSRASSGTASPSPAPAHFAPGLLAPHAFQHSHTPHEPSHLHSPIDVHEDSIHQGDDGDRHDGHVSRPSLESMSRSHSSSSVHSHEEHAHSDSGVPTIMTTTNVHSIPPSQAQVHAKKLKKKEEEVRDSASGGTMMGYIATLQSKRAWDALIHGSMS